MESQNLCASVDDGLTDAEPMEEVTKEEEKSTPPDDKAQKQKKSSTFKTTRRLLTRYGWSEIHRCETVLNFLSALSS